MFSEDGGEQVRQETRQHETLNTSTYPVVLFISEATLEVVPRSDVWSRPRQEVVRRLGETHCSAVQTS